MDSDPVYIAYYFNVRPINPAVEILIAELGLAGFESFVETEAGLNAFIQKKDYHDHILDDVMILKSSEFDIHYTTETIAQVNWNEAWETSFEPIVVDDQCTVRAPFHEQPSTTYDIIIEPKMSFGTGHHETTHMMIRQMLKLDLEGKTVLDMGCGTGVLAILAEKRNAAHVDAIDIDHWCYLNSLENVERNTCKHISVAQGDAGLLSGKNYDVILANINRNVLLEDLAGYIDCLNPDGILVLSGFYEADIPLIQAVCDEFMLKLAEKIVRNDWVSLKFIN